MRYDRFKNEIVIGGKKSGELSISKDRSLQTSLLEIKKAKEETKNLDKLFRKELGAEDSKIIRALAKFFNRVVPERAYGWMPNSMVRFIAEENDILEYIAFAVRDIVNRVQGATLNLVDNAASKKEEMRLLAQHIASAKKENWDAQQLQNFLIESINKALKGRDKEVTIDPRIQKLLDEKFDLLTSEQKEKRRAELLALLGGDLVIGEGLVKLYESACDGALSTFNVLVSFYYLYTSIYPHAAVLRNSSTDMLDAGQTMYAGKEVIKKTIELATRNYELAIEAGELIQRHSIASKDLKNLLEEGRERLERKRIEIENKKQELFLINGGESLLLPPAENTAAAN